MVQELHVVRCFSCENFQTQIVKKTNKWDCKVCGVKQSIKKVYGRGSGKDCRLHTQKLNALRGGLEDGKIGQCEDGGPWLSEATQQPALHSPAPLSSISDKQQECTKTSKWAEFIDEEKADDTDDHTDDTIDNEQPVILNLQFVGSCSRKKRKYEKRPVKSSQTSLSAWGNLDEFGNSFTQPESHKKINGKRFKANENFNSESGRDFYNNIELSEYDHIIKESTSKLQPSKKRDLSQKNINVNSLNPRVGKWGKYLANEEIDKNSSQLADEFLDERSCVIKEGFTSSSLNTTVPLANGSDWEAQSNSCDNGYKSSSSLTSFKSSQCEKISFDPKLVTRVPIDKSENKKTNSTLPDKLFDQGSDISDLDLDISL